MSKNINTIKTTLAYFLIYVVSTTIISGVLVTVWMSGQNIEGLSSIEVQLLAETSITIQIASGAIGFTVCTILSILLALKTAQSNFKALYYFALTLTCYSIMGVMLHPEHAIVHQLLKLIVPGVIAYSSMKWALAKNAVAI